MKLIKTQIFSTLLVCIVLIIDMAGSIKTDTPESQNVTTARITVAIPTSIASKRRVTKQNCSVSHSHDNFSRGMERQEEKCSCSIRCLRWMTRSVKTIMIQAFV
jgi:hypothetical protein